MKAKFLELFPTPQANRLIEIFDLMEIAEREISLAMAKHPKCAADLYDTFKYLTPTRFMGSQASLPKEVYRSHCRELLQRVVEGDNLDDPTAAELVYLFSITSEKAPLTNDAVEAMRLLFNKCFPDRPFMEAIFHESYNGAIQNLIDDASKKLHNIQPKRL